MAADPELAEAWRLARALGAAPVTSTARFPRWKIIGIGTALAAALLLGVRATLPTDPIGPGSSEFRDGEVSELASATDPGALPRDAFTLRWTGAPEGSRYSVRISTPDLTVLDEVAGLSDAAYTVPADKLGEIAAGDAVIWQVEARLPDGREVRSQSFTTRLR